MSRVPARGFQTAANRAINWIGNVSVADVVQMNNEPEWENALADAASKIETQVDSTTLPSHSAKCINETLESKGRRC